jgi:type IV pilus assembly protein PilB
MGIEPYLIGDTLLGVLAQRLVRKNCTACLAEENIDPHVYAAVGVDKNEKFYRGKGCELCNNTGYKGRQAAYELLTVSPKLRSLINNRVSADAINQQALEDGMTPLTQNAIDLARKKITSLAEAYRVRLS